MIELYFKSTPNYRNFLFGIYKHITFDNCNIETRIIRNADKFNY